MKRLTILLCVFACCKIIQAQWDFQNIFKMLSVTGQNTMTCTQKRPLSQDDMTTIQTFIQRENVSQEEAERFFTKFACLIGCLLEEAGAIQGTQLQLNSMMRLAQSNSLVSMLSVNPMIRTCTAKAEQQTDNCEIAITFISCLVQRIMQPQS